MPRQLLGCLAACVALSAAIAPAAGQDGDVAAAEALFREARALMKAGRYEKACPKLEESNRLDPGVGTLANLARCYEKTNRLASAWAKYREAADEATRRGEKKRAQQAAKKADKLEPKLHRVAIIVGKSSRVDGLTITRNGRPVGVGSYGSKVPMDEGDVTVTASAPGYKTFTKTISLATGRRTRVIEIPPLEKSPVVAPPPGDDDDDGKDDKNGEDDKIVGPVSRFESVPGPPWYKDSIGWALLAGGVAVAAGGAFGALPHARDVEASAREGGIGLEEADRRYDEADQFKRLGYGLIGVGGAVAIIGGIKLMLNPPTLERRTDGSGAQASQGAAVFVGPRSVALRLRF